MTVLSLFVHLPGSIEPAAVIGLCRALQMLLCESNFPQSGPCQTGV